MERTHELADSFKEFFWQGVQQVHGCIQNKCNNLLRRHSYQRTCAVLMILSSWFGPFDKRGWWKLGKKANYISGNRKRKFYCIPYNSRTSRHKLPDRLTVDKQAVGRLRPFFPILSLDMASTKRAIEADERIPILFLTRLPIRRGGEGFHSSRRAHKVNLWCNGPCWTIERRISVLLS